MNLRRSRSSGSTRSFRLPLFIYIQDPSMSTFPWSEVWPYSFMLAVTLCATPLPHTITNSFFLIHGRHSPSSRTSLPYIWRTQVGHVVVTLRTRTNPPSLLRPCFSQPYCCCFKTPYLFFTQSTLHLSLSGNCPCSHTSLLSSYPPLLIIVWRRRARWERAPCVADVWLGDSTCKTN
ncbi:hypothetical protein BJY52DRAFT_255990 [Lactarius psammicola]|nr:hypothetical protein BJY52DRAFT_255990 [Lactarius psammicola]